MSRRKELNKDNYSADTEIPEGDEQHPVWQAAFGSAFSVNEGNIDSVVRLYRVATSTADMAYAMYKESIGVHKRTKQSNGKGSWKNEESFSMGNHKVVGQTNMAIGINTPEHWIEEFEHKEIAWIPLSQIHGDSEVDSKDQEGEILVTAWWAKKRGIYGGEENEKADDRIPF